MGTGIILIVVGVVVWKLLPGWISFNSRESREVTQQICNIIGIVFLIIGIVILVATIL